MDRKQFFYGQAVQYSDLNGAFDQVEKRFKDFFQDTGSNGVAKTPYRSGTNELYALEAPTPNMTIKIKPGAGYTRDGQRVNSDVDVILNAAVDSNGDPTIPAAGNERYISIFAVPTYNESEPKLDPINGGTINFTKTVEASFIVVAGAEVAIAVPTNAVPPIASTSAILLADILLADSTTAIVEALFDRSRKEEFTLRSTIIQPDSVLNMVRNLGESVTVGENSWIFRENFPSAWVYFDATPGTNPINPFTVRSKFNVEKVERLVAGTYKVYVPFDLFAATDDAFALATHDTAFGGIQMQGLTLSAPDAYFTISTWAGDPPGAVEPTRVGVFIIGRPYM